MAALICDTCGKGCNGAFSLCLLPCKVCGTCCEGGCDACTKCCSSTCSALGGLICSPFFPYLAVTAIFNLPPALWGAKEITTRGCNISWWLWANALFCLAHVVASIYISIKVQNQNDSGSGEENDVAVTSNNPNLYSVEVGDGTSTAAKGDSDNTESKKPSLVQAFAQNISAQERGTRAGVGDGNNETSGSSRKRMVKILCYDAGVAIYMVTALVWLAFLAYGFSLTFGDDGACDSTQNLIYSSIGMGCMYSMLVFCTLSCSLLCLG